MPIETLTTSQAAERLEIPLSTLKAWLERLDLPLPVDSRGRRLLDERALTVLTTVRSLRERDLGYETIRRKLAEDGVPVGGQPGGAMIESTTIAEVVREAVRDALDAREASVYEELGRLRERVAHLQDQLDARDAELRRLARELATSRGDDHVDAVVVPMVETAMTEAPSRPTWKFW